MDRTSKLVLASAVVIAIAACLRAQLRPRSAAEGSAPEGFASEDTVPAGAGATQTQLGNSFRDVARKNRDLETAELLERLGADRDESPELGFDPRQVRYYDRIVEHMKLTTAEQELFRKQGLVGVDIGQRSSMGSAYFTIYTRDLPVLVTSDSILHAFHRSFDASLEQLEVAVLQPILDETLARAEAQLEREARSVSDPELRDSLADVDLYLAVARRLSTPEDAVWPKLASASDVQALLDKVDEQALDDPEGPCTEIYGGKRCIDYSQFKPRGHYTHSKQLSQYFRALMWLGRADLGWNLRTVDPQSGVVSFVDRERRNAATISLVLEASGGLPRLQTMNSLVELWLGRSDNVTVPVLSRALDAAHVETIADLAEPGVLDRVDRALDAVAAPGQQIRSQVLDSPRNGPRTKLPFEFQMLGQRFLLDSFVLANVVYDSIVYRGEKQERMMPSGLDVMAALGNDEAVRLLQPALEQYHYSANLLAARKVVDGYGEWEQSAYNRWLAALRTLDDEPASPNLPKVMRTRPWRRKQLQTQLASWAELRHDTILYGKQSYTAFLSCEYPMGFVEPYPEFFRSLSGMARALSQALDQRAIDEPVLRIDSVKRQVEFFEHFANTVDRLEALAEKELRAEPFSDDERLFLKKTIDIRSAGSGPPRYDGWYPQLILSEGPAKWKPEVADVHTDPRSQTALQVGVGDVAFLVVAIDNESDRAAYVGPIYSYYEFVQSARDRLSDEQWQQKVAGGELPARPEWTKSFQQPTVVRQPGR